MKAELVAKFEKRYAGGAIVQGELRLPINGFSITVLFGPSGCGKTTILRCLAGLERPEQGAITFGDEVWFDREKGVFRSPQQRGIGYLFQEYALFPHLTVADNIAYSLQGATAHERKQKVAEMLERFELVGLEHRYPQQISGGQQQRAALARTLISRPRLLLLDEPLSALDAMLREQLREELRRLLAAFRLPVVVVTHDRAEVHALADQVVILDQGITRQAGPVGQVFEQ